MKKLLVAIFSLATLCSSTAMAAEHIEIDVNTDISPTQAVGFVISSNGTEQRLETSWKKSADGIISVSVPIARKDRIVGTVVTAMVVAQDGATAFGNTKPAWIAEASSTFYSLPECPIRKAPKGLESQMGLIQSLVDVRTARRNYLQLKINGILSGSLLEKLSNLEQGFGLENDRELSGGLHPTELVDRIDRLHQAIVNYRSKKPAPEAAKPTAPETSIEETAVEPATEE